MAKIATLMPTVANNRDITKWEHQSDAPAQRSKHKVIQTITFRLGNFDDDNRTFRAIASTPIVDRSGDTIDQDGWDVSNFVENPVIPWCHDYWQLPVARATEVGVADGALQFTYQAPPKGMYEFADTVWDLYRNQFMFAFSVGFIPKKKDGTALSWDDYDWDGTDYEAAELLEISAVVVPANPQALALSQKSGLVDNKAARSLIDKTASAMKHLEESLQSEQETSAKQEALTFDALQKAVERAVEKAMSKKLHEEQLAKGVISSDLPTAPKDRSWDSGAAVKAAKSWASDSNGDIDFSKYKKAFMWVDSAGGDKQGDYKLPFADIVDDQPKAVWNACKAIMSVLNGGRGGVNVPDGDRKGIYNQVKKYYKKFDEEVPDLKDVNDNALTPEDDVADNGDMKTSSASKNKDLGLGSDGGGSTAPTQMASGQKENGYAMADGLHELADTLKAHAEALNGHAQTMKAHSALVAKNVDALHKAADYLKDILDHQGDETTENTTNGAGDDGLDGSSEIEEENYPDTRLTRIANPAKKKAQEDGEENVEEESAAAESETEVAAAAEEDAEAVSAEKQPEEGEPQKGNLAANEEESASDKKVEDSGEVNSEEETPTEGADHSGEAKEDLVDPDDLSEEQIQKLLEMVNAELKSETIE